MNPTDSSPKVDSAPLVMTVTALNQAVARMLEKSFPLAWVAGEVSNFTRAASGHWYFTLKDDAAQVRAVMFRGRAQYADFTPREGDKVEVRTLVTLYAPRGDYQLNVETIRRAGAGNLYEAFLQLKAKLAAEGLFDNDRKRPLPAFARTIGILTSLQAAALRDILTTLRRRAPHVRVVLYPTPVQGDGASQKITAAIGLASARKECDVLLVCRGGGSIEDLWSFNHESVARAIASCAIPVIVGVGHETDFTIADFVADMRAPTPTAAAELAAAPRADRIAALQSRAQHLTRAMQRRLSDSGQALDWLSRRLIGPTAYIAHERMRLRELRSRLAHATRSTLIQSRHSLAQQRSRLATQLPDIAGRRMQLQNTSRHLANCSASHLARQKQLLSALSSQLELLNPQRTLERGYAIVTDAKGQVIRGPADLHPRTTIAVRLAKGSAEVGIASVQPTLD